MEHALLQLINGITNSLEKKKFILGVSLNLSNAFDDVNHDILLIK